MEEETRSHKFFSHLLRLTEQSVVSESVAALDSSQDFLLVLHWQDWPDTLTGEGVLSGVGGDYN